mgnify:CR=1 FL=1|tara:strand:+ start:724 stop:924 length:201 start_codon:yes stop_codon:yes gene_type:complete
MINIDDVEYTEDDLSEIAQMHVKRVNALRNEAGELQMLLDEKKVLISAYANAIRESVKPAEKAEKA